MRETARLQRLAQVRGQLRRLGLAELLHRSEALSRAEDARQAVLAHVAGQGEPELGWLALRTGQLQRTARDVAAAAARVSEQQAVLMEAVAVDQLIARRLQEARVRERSQQEAKALAELIDQLAAATANSAAKG